MRVVVFTGGDAADESSVRTEVEGFVLKGETVHYLVDLLDDLSRRGPRSAAFRVAERAEEIASARRFVAHHGQAWGYDDVIDDAMIVVSELVTNAIVHAAQLVRPAVEGRRSHPAHRGHRRRSRKPGTAASGSAHAEHGRGLLLVSAMCAAWGVDTLGDGRKMVWAELKNAPLLTRVDRPMLDHLSIQCADFDAERSFYDDVLVRRWRARARLRHRHRLRLSRATELLDRSADDRRAEPRVHIAFQAADRAAVQAFFAAAVARGAEVLHEPRVWPEYHPDYYGGFVRDPDGNNVEAVCHLPEE